MAWRPKAGGWAARRGESGGAASSSTSSGGRVARGEILRTSPSGFGFIGDSPQARKRLYFHFKDVVGNVGPGLKVGQRVTYKTRMNDDTMETEAFDVAPDGEGGRSGGRGAARQSGIRMGTGGRSGAGREGRKNRFANLSGKVSGTSQATRESRDQYGQARAVNSGSLLGIIGCDDGDVAAVVSAKSCDDYEHNPTGGLGFFRAYQEGRGFEYVPPPVLVPEGEGAEGATAGAAGDPYAPSAEGGAARPPGPPSWASRRGKGRSLAEMMED